METLYNIKSVIKDIKENVQNKVEVTIPKIRIEKPETDDIGKQIAYYRKLKGWNQTQLAEKLGVTKSCINSYENRPIKIVNVKFLKSIFNVLEIENKVNLPEYENFIFNNQQDGIKKILEENKLNCFQLAKIIGVDDTNVQKWTKGESVMSRKSYNRLVKKRLI